MLPHVTAIILAAGKGTRINAPYGKNKVTYSIAQKPIIAHTVTHLHQAGITNIIVVVGHAAASVKKALGDSVSYAHQAKRLGTGHAVKTAFKQVLPGTKSLLVMYGDDSAFYPPKIFKTVVSKHQLQNADISVVTIKVDNPHGLGRIIRNQAGYIQAIIEEKVATLKQKQINEINTGLFCFNASFLQKNLKKIQKNPISHEYYLTDLVQIAVNQNIPVYAHIWPDNTIWHGVNTRLELQAAQKKRLPV